MSIKIYQTWRVEKVHTLPQLNAFAETLKAAFKQHLIGSMRQLFHSKENYHKYLIKSMCSEIKVRDAGAVIFFYPARRGVNFLLMDDTYEYHAVLDNWSRPEYSIKKWGYWNNTDRDPSVSGREWGLRKKDWEGFCDKYLTFSEGMFCFQVTHGFPQCNLPWVEEVFPDEVEETKNA